jgi:hypothetical protein
MLERTGHRGHPCLTPQLIGLKSDSFDFNFMAIILFLYSFYIAVII